MLGILFIYFLGKYFYVLASENDRNEWGYAILGVATYYIGSILCVMLLVIAMEISSPGWVDGMSDFVLGIMGIPFGLFTAWMLYLFLEKRFKDSQTLPYTSSDPNIIDDGFLKND